MSEANRTQGRTNEIIITGFGGQGIILAGNIMGKAAALYDKMNASLIQSYGPEARGGACAAQVIISDQVIEYPYVEEPSVLVCMSQEGFGNNIGALLENGLLFTDSGLVAIEPDRLPAGCRVFSIPASALAEEMGVRMMANIIMLGFAAGVSELISYEALKKAVLDSVPKGTEEKNMAGLDRGYQAGRQALEQEAG